ncbi:MAG: quinolinate synthase NadA [Candidatus Hydrogenedentes bacterium]|nr:quinolinate synthase NadA [Candidatus Hydrogenedentota bacterium]
MENKKSHASFSYEQLLKNMRERLRDILPPFEIELKAELAYKILKLKAERNAVILGHNYMEPALYHSIPDYVGDSLQLSIVASKTNAEIIVFCGVWFMGETAKILNPKKMVLVPSREAGCSLAEGITKDQILQLKEKFPGIPVVTYVNTYAEAKAESDYCCTSGNADKVLSHVFSQGYKAVIFLPDEYLAKNTAEEINVRYLNALEASMKDIEQSNTPVVLGWNAKCEVHEQFTSEDVEFLRMQFPGVTILAHPECSPDVIRKVDYTGSTKGMIDFVKSHPTGKYALLTECAMGDNIQAEFPEVEIVRACTYRCKHMNLITLEQTLHALERLQFVVEIEPHIIEKARLPIERMISIK